MFRLQCIGIVLLVLVDLPCYFSNDTEEGTILDFLELHSTYCTTSQLCSIRNNRTLKREPCCQPCSCEKECENEFTCCPDILMHKVLDNITFGDATSLRKNVHHLNDTSVLGMGNDFKDFDDNGMYKCVDYRLRTGYIYFEVPKIKQAYEMIALCPKSYLDNTHIKSLCEVSADDYRKSMGNINSSDLEDLVRIFTPVTSLKTNITYRNVYCLECSGENITDNPYVSWTAFFTCGMFWSTQIFIPKDSPYELFEHILETRDAKNECNIILKPSKIIEHLIPKTCSPSDFKTCPLGTDTRLDLFCRRINLPIKQDEGRIIKIYRNIACFLCNQNKPFVEFCTSAGYFFSNEKFFEIGLNIIPTAGLLSVYLQPNTKNINGGKSQNSSESIQEISLYTNENNAREQGIMAVSTLEFLKELSSSFCKNNNESLICADIMCPEYFYQSHGECIPTFTSVKGVYFSICLEIKLAQAQQLDFVLPVMTSTLDGIAKSLFNDYSFDVWYPVEEDKQNMIVVIINIASTDRDFIRSMNRIDIFLLNMTNIRLQTELGLVDIGFKLRAKYFYQFVGVDKQIILGLPAIALEAYKRGTQLAMPLNEMELLRTMGCYRIVYESEDNYLNSINYISQRSENSTFFYKYITCIDDAIPTGLSTTDAFMFKGFAGKTLNPMNNIQNPVAIFNVSKNDTGFQNRTSSSSVGFREPEATFNLSKTDTKTNEQKSSSSDGVLKSSLTVAVSVTLALILGTIKTNK